MRSAVKNACGGGRNAGRKAWFGSAWGDGCAAAHASLLLENQTGRQRPVVGGGWLGCWEVVLGGLKQF